MSLATLVTLEPMVEGEEEIGWSDTLLLGA